MKKLIVKDGCIGCGACVAIDSEHFDFNDEGLSNVISNENLETDELTNAIASCPVSVIKLVEEAEGSCGCHAGCTCGEDCNCTADNKCSEDCTCGDECHCGDNCECSEGCNCHK
ncbi:MAG: ferredoxin [Bacilli bacterium]|nr:ferredoxin [Bacilli bacterium]